MSILKANQLGLAGEFRVMSELLLRGHNPAKSYLEDGPDLILENGVRIEVKSAHKHIAKRAERYLFSVRGGHRKERQNLDGCDFIICWCVNDDCFYIIPKTQVTQRTSICIGTQNSTFKPYKGNWEILNREVI